jgi:hypothetical protein
VAYATLLAVGVAGVRLHLDPWAQAAGMRDAVLRSAHARLGSADCLAASFEGLPDSVRGAYVFRNGFAEAMSLEGDPDVRIEDGGARADCSFRWTGESFQPGR